MSIFLDQKFLLHIAPHLRNFKQKKDNLYNFSCPFCGDSHKKTTKARGYVFDVSGSYIYKCHNCTRTTNLGQLIREVDPSSYRQYVLESFNNSHIVYQPTKITKSTSMFAAEKDISLETLEGLPTGHWVFEYVTQRQIPKSVWSRLYFAPDFRSFVDDMYPNYSKNLPADDPRLIIPFYNEYNVLTGFQGRALRNTEIRYVTIKISDDIKCYGMDTVDFSKTIYVLEGPIDSMFLPNAVATCDSDLRKAANWLPKKNLVLIYDNEYHATEIRKLVERSIADGFNVCIWPKTIKQKDVNDLIISGLTSEKIKTIIDQNTFSGLRAKAELINVTN